MKSSFESFKTGYQQIQDHLNWIALVNHSSADEDNELSKFWIHHKVSLNKLNNNAVMISLYGLFEEFIESIIEEYILKLNSICTKFEEYPKKIQDNHEELSVRLLGARLLSKYESRLNFSDIYGNLKGIVDRDSSVNINSEPYSFHGANLKREVLAELFSNIGVVSLFDQISQDGKFQESLEDKNFTREDVFSWIDDNAQIRNQIAHTFNGIIENFEESFMKQRLLALKIFCEAVSRVAMKNCLQSHPRFEEFQLSKVIDVIDHKIVCFEMDREVLQIGDFLISINGKGKVSFSEIEEIQVNNVKQDTVKVDNPIEEKICVGVRANHKFKMGNSFYLFEKSIIC